MNNDINTLNKKKNYLKNTEVVNEYNKEKYNHAGLGYLKSYYLCS